MDEQFETALIAARAAARWERGHELVLHDEDGLRRVVKERWQFTLAGGRGRVLDIQASATT